MRELFASFFNRPDTFGLGVCNGCQMFSILKDLIPEHPFGPNSLLIDLSSSKPDFHW